MIKLKDNWLLYQIVIVYAIFISIGMFLPKPYVSSATAIAALAAGLLMAARYAETTIDIVMKGRRGVYGAHNAVLGAAELGAGIVYSGLYRLIWIYMDRPQGWSATVWSSIGLFMIAKGAYRMAISPDDVKPSQRFPEGFKMIALWVFGLVIAFVAGTHVNEFGP